MNIVFHALLAICLMGSVSACASNPRRQAAPITNCCCEVRDEAGTPAQRLTCPSRHCLHLHPDHLDDFGPRCRHPRLQCCGHWQPVEQFVCGCAAHHECAASGPESIGRIP